MSLRLCENPLLIIEDDLSSFMNPHTMPIFFDHDDKNHHTCYNYRGLRSFNGDVTTQTIGDASGFFA